MEKMKVYISGKIGEVIVSDATRRRFERAQKMLEAKGYETVNPASEEYQRQLTQLLNGVRLGRMYAHQKFNRLAEIMRIDFERMTVCDAVYMLRDWSVSHGASLEYDFAEYAGIPCLFEESQDAQYYLERKYMFEVKPSTGEYYDQDNEAHQAERDIYVTRNLGRYWLPIKDE